MLWTVFRNQPFEECLEKVVEAGYQGVELVGEFKKWSEEGRAKNKDPAAGEEDRRVAAKFKRVY